MHFEMKQMVYTADRNREVLDIGEYKGFTYAIISLGWHPCAYVKIPENHKYFNVDYNDLPMIDCHGGITYSESYLAVADDKDLDGWWIGWDYSHCMDFSGRFLRPNNFIMEGKKYSTAEILSDVFKVIEQLESDKYINYTEVRNDLKEDIYNILSVIDDDNHLKTKLIINILDKLAAADVQEVRHGKWESTELMYENGCTRCSECKTEYYVGDLEEICGDTLPTFCPNCGARMDGDV